MRSAHRPWISRGITHASILTALAFLGGCRFVESTYLWYVHEPFLAVRDVSKQPEAWGGFVRNGLYRVHRDLTPQLTEGTLARAVGVRYDGGMNRDWYSMRLRIQNGDMAGRTVELNISTLNESARESDAIADEYHPLVPNPAFLTLVTTPGD